MSVSLRRLDPKNKNSTNSEWWTDERIEKWDFRGWAQVSNVLVQHQQASGVMRAPWNVGKRFADIWNIPKRMMQHCFRSESYQQQVRKISRDRYPKCLSRPTTTTTTTKQDLESYRWLVTNCKYSFPAWRHANLADSCQMRSVSNTSCQSPCKGNTFFLNNHDC